MFIRRRGGPGRPQTTVAVQVGLFFLGAGVWIAGALVGSGWITGVAIVILLLAMLLRLLPQREPRGDGAEPPE